MAELLATYWPVILGAFLAGFLFKALLWLWFGD